MLKFSLILGCLVVKVKPTRLNFGCHWVLVELSCDTEYSSHLNTILKEKKLTKVYILRSSQYYVLC